jgi:hypothetical protein
MHIEMSIEKYKTIYEIYQSDYLGVLGWPHCRIPKVEDLWQALEKNTNDLKIRAGTFQMENRWPLNRGSALRYAVFDAGKRRSWLSQASRKAQNVEITKLRLQYRRIWETVYVTTGGTALLM